MANYHYSVNPISRGKGRSVTAAAAYRAGVDIHDSRTGEHHNYSNRNRYDAIIESDIRAPKGSPQWVYDRAVLWNTIEHREDKSTRPNQARLAREVEVSLPYELTHEQRKELLTAFVRDRYVAKGMIADISYHAPGRGGDDRNYHAHILLTLRPMNDNGEFVNVNRTWNAKHVLLQDREEWANYVNRALERAGHVGDVDHRSFYDRRIDRIPTKHLGVDATRMERKGEPSRIGDENREAQEYNREMTQLEDEGKVINLEVEREKRRWADAQKRQAVLAQKKGTDASREKAQSSEDATALLAQRQHALRLKQLDERRTLEAEIDRYRHQMETSTNKFYNRDEAVKALKTAQNELESAKTTFGRLSGRQQVLQERVEALRLNLEDVDRRQNEQKGQMERFANEQLAALDAKHQEETKRLHDPPSPDLENETKDLREYTPDAPTPRAVNDNEKFPDRDPDPGPELDR